ncbi:MAG: hypothetical protein ABIQ12_06290 [Opitutaceae bacterium]
MGFDKDDTRPIIKPGRKTTKVNLGMVAAVLIFLALGAVAIYWMTTRHSL